MKTKLILLLALFGIVACGVRKEEAVSENEKIQNALAIARKAQEVHYDGNDPNGGERSKEVLTAMLKSLQLIDSLQIKDFDPSKYPAYMNVAPPILPADGFAVAGMAPEGIKDPVARKAYEEAIAKNRANMEIINNQHFLKLEKESLLNHIKVFLLNHKHSAIRGELLHMAEQSGFIEEIKAFHTSGDIYSLE